MNRNSTALSRLQPMQAARDLAFVRCPRRVRRALGWHLNAGPGVAFTRLALLAGAVMSAQPLWASPTGAQVVAGQVNVVSSVPGTLNIQQGTSQAIINWQSFNIAAGETVNFIQPSLNSVTLNRVLGNDPSSIFGRLTANGTVVLVNPNGVLFGPSARIDVGGLVASTANIRDDDFLAGRWRFGEASANAQARIVNAGEISIRDSGLAALVAPSVQNSGVIQARLGRVMLGGAARFTLDFQGDGLLSFAAGEAVNAQVLNTGTLRADGGTVLLGASAVKGVVDQVINTSGVISATTVSGTPGRIVLAGGDSGTVAVSGTLQAGGTVGGSVIVNGEQVQVGGGARIDVSGTNGGGEIALGSDGRASGYANMAQGTTVASGARLSADALVAGDGGHITLWSRDTTRFAGSLSARGAGSGNGGFAEVSSRKNIGLTGTVDLRSTNGKAGTLLLDPTDLRITDSAGGGSQDGNATDGSVAAGDANQGSGATLNTVSRGLLESLSGNANIVLQATGQVTVDAMAGGVLNLATTAGHGFTLQSTQSGGIRFVDAATEIRTQGGDISLDAQGLGSTLANIGRLSSNGGAITLRATGDIQLAGALNAGSGALNVQTTVGSISNAGAATPLLGGGTVSLSAPGGHIGAAGQALHTHTGSLTLETGGHAVVANDSMLNTLSLTANHVAPTLANDYQISATGLALSLADGSALGVTEVTQGDGLNLTLRSDRSLQLGTVNVGSGSLLLASTDGNLLGAADTALTAASLTLQAQGSNGNNGAIGTSGQALLTNTAHLDATAGSGGAYVSNTGTLALDRLSATGASGISSSGTLTAASVNVGSATLSLGSGGGSVLDDGDTSTRISAGTLALSAGGAIGSAGNRVATNASTISANAGLGGVYASTTATSSVLSSIVSGDGAIDIRTGGSTTLTSLVSSTSGAGNGITVAATGTGSFSVGTVNAGAAGDVSLSTSSGSIFGNTGLITGNLVTLNAATSGSVTVRTAAQHLDVQAGSSSISITQTGAVTLDRLSTPSSLVSVTSSSGDITVGSISTSSGGQVSLTASAGSIRDDGNSATRIGTGTAVLSASGAIGAPGQAVQTKATGLTVSSTGDLVISNTEATLNNLSVTNRHSAPGNAATLQVDSPYLTFDVTDTGSGYDLTRLVGIPLNSLSFNGDGTLVLGQVQAAGSVSLTSTQGLLVDDGNLNTRVTAGSTLVLSAAQGGIGSLANPVSANATSLTLTTRGDLYLTDIADLSTLTINSSHADASTSYGMAITAPSLRLDVTDSAAGHAVHTLTDTSSLTLNFTSDRDITLGRVDLSTTGTARFTSSAGSILDDGDKSTQVLANSSTFSGRAVGAVGAGYLDVVTGTLAATASAGGVYVQLPMPTGSSNTTSTVTLGTVTATGPVAINALEGDLSLGGFLTATNQAVSLTAAQGSILSPFGYGITIGNGSLTLNAAQAIGASGSVLPVTNTAGATLTAQAGTSMFVSGSGPMTLSALDATAGITYTQSSGAITVGRVDATAGSAVSLSATGGAIQDDGDGATGITGNRVTLSAATSSVGSAGSAIAVNTPKLLVTANGAVNVADSATLDTLSLTRGSGSAGSIAISAGAGQSFTITEDAGAHDVQAVSSSTPLAFSFSGQRDVQIGAISVGATGSASFTSTTNLLNSTAPSAGISAGTVSLTSGSAGSIGTSGSAIALTGTSALTLSTGRNAYVAGDVALTDLSITSTNTTTAAGTASLFGISSLGQTFAISDSGTTQSLDFGGTALSNFIFTTRKNIQVGAITASGDVTLVTSGGGANSNISSDGGSGRIAGNRVLLTATSSSAGGGSIGSSGTALRVDAPRVILNGSGNVYVDDAQNLALLDMTLTHGTNTTFGYGVTAGNVSSFAVTDGSTQSLGLAVSGAMDFAYSVDRALNLATIDTGTSSSGSIALTSRSAPTGTNAQINRGSGSLTAGRIALSAVGSNGSVGGGATLSTNTQNLSVASGGNVGISNSTTLRSLSLDAQHRTSGSSTLSYAISSTGLSFSISDTLGSNAFQLANISQSGLDLSVKADRVITASNVNTGAGGRVTLNSSSYVQGGSGANAGSPSITTGELTLRGGSAFGYQGSTPLYTAASTLDSTLSNTLYLSNAGALTLGTNTVSGSADVASSNNSLLQGVGGLFTTPTLKLSANQSLGATGTLLTDARRLTLVSRGDVDVSNASDLYALTLTSTHGAAGVQNTVSVAAPRLTLSLTDSVGGNEYHLASLVDSSGLDFSLSTDVALNLGSVNAQAGRSLALYSTGTGTSITNDGSSLLKAGSITLSAAGSVGAAGGSGTRMQTDALGLTLITGANAHADNAQDLSSLSLTSTQNPGGSAPVYQVTAPSLSFDISDDGTTHVNQVADSTGLNFTLSTRRDQAVDVINLGRSGSVSLTSVGDILGDADSSHRISAGIASFTASNGGAIGSVGNPIHLSVPLTSFAPTGALNVESDTHIDRLTISTTHPTVTYGGAYSIVSVPFTGAAYPLFSATDSVTGTALTSLDDPLGLAFSFTSDRAMQVGTLNLGQTGTVTLTGTSSGGILGDGNPNTLVQAASLSMTSLGGAIGATGSGNGIDATVNSVSASALGGGVNLALHGRTQLGSISGTGGVNLANDDGDIALGSINAGGSAVSINNQGGSILSGSISNATTVSLTASGSIGNNSAVTTSANGGGTTTLTASASAAHGASGSIALSESYNLAAASVTAPAAVTLSSGYALGAGTITSGGAVDLSSSQGSITGIDGSNAITGTRVTLSARYGTGNGIGSSGTRLNLNTPQLVLNTPGSVYVTDSADLNRLTIDRTNYSANGSAGTLSVIASGLSFSATDSANTTTLTSLSDGTGLDFSYLGVGSLAIGSVNAGSGSVLLQAYLSSGDGNINAINGSSLITAGSLTLQAYGSSSNIGSSGTPLGLAVGSLTASSGTGGMALRQAGSLNLASLSTTGDMAVTASSGDLTLGTLSYGSGRTLSLTASGGRILAGGGTLAGGGANAAITLSAADGIGTELAPVLVNASAGHTVSASVTGSGSLYLSSLGTLNGGLSTSVHDGATLVTAAGSIRLTSMTSGTDAVGNDIRVTASAGDITVQSVSGGAGAAHTAVNLAANAGRLLANPGATLEAFDVRLHGATGVGSSSNRVSADGQRVQVSSNGGAIYLTAATPAVLSAVESNGGAIDITHSADLLLANALSSGGSITVSSSTAGADLVAGNINAGSGAVSLSTTGAGATLVDDGNRSTAISGGTVTLNAAGGVGSAQQSLQTAAATLNVTSGTGITIDDSRSAGVTLNSVIASNGGVSVGSAGDMNLVEVRASGTNGVSLTAGGAITAGAGTAITADHAALSAAGSIGAGTPVRVALASGALTLSSGGAAAVVSSGDLNFSGGLDVQHGDLSLVAGGLLTLPGSAISTTGGVNLSGGTDVLGSGATPRQLTITGSSLAFSSGAAGGSTNLVTQVGSLQASLSGAGDLTVNNTGTLASTTLSTSSGDISATSSTGLNAGSVLAGGGNRSISLTATAGDLTVGTVNAGSGGSINLSAAQGALVGASANLTAQTLGLVSGSGIGSAGAAFDTSATNVSAQVTGNGGIYLSSAGALNLGTLATNGGDIAVSAAGGIRVGTVATTGTQSYTGGLTLSGNLTGAAILVDGALTLAGGTRTLTGDVHVTGALDGGSFGASFNGGTGNVLLDGAASNLASLTASGASIRVAGVSTSGAQSYTGATTLNGSYATTGGAFSITGTGQLAGATQISAGSGNVQFGGTLGGANTLVVNSSGATRFDGAVTVASVTTDAAGTLAINAGSVTTTGAQSYGEHLVLGSDLVLAGSSLNLAQGADAAVAGQQGLTLTGNVVLPAALGGQAALKSLTISGDAVLNNAGVTTTGAQSYGGTLTLGADTVLTGNGVSIAGSTNGAAALTVAAGSGNVSFGGAVGNNAVLRSLTISGSGNTTLNGNVSTSGVQSYGQHLLLAADAVLSGSALTLAGGVDATGNAGLTLAGSSTLNGGVGTTQALRSFSTNGPLTLGAGVVNTSGAQNYGGALVLTGSQVMSGSAVAFGGTVGGAHDLTVNSSGATRFDGAVNVASVSTDAAGTLAINGGSVSTSGAQSYGERAVMGAATTLAGSRVALRQGADAPALTINGNTVLGGNVSTGGAQHYAGTLALVADVVLAGGSVAIDGHIDGSAGAQALALRGAGVSGGDRALTINSSGATVIGGTVQAASLTTDAAGTLALNGGSVTTTGAQSYGERAVLGADTTLSGSQVSLLAGADATTAGAQGLTIVGNAAIGGAVGAQQALKQLDVSGSTTLAAGSVSTTGNQRFGGAVQLLGDQQLHSTAGNLMLTGTLDASGRANLSLASDAGAVSVAGAVGSTDVLGALTVNAATTLDFGSSIRAYRLQQTVGGESHHLGTVWVDGSEGISVSSAGVRFDGAVTATTGALNVALTANTGTLRFATGADVSTATGFTQTGGAAVVLPASVYVTQGNITLAAPATLPEGTARIETEGDITIAGLSGPSTTLTLAAGHGRLGSAGAGRLLIGLDDGNPLHLLDVASLVVTDAASAQLFGRIGGKGGAMTASLVRGGLVNAPYYANGTPWGPLEVINRLVSTTVPVNVVPSVPSLLPLFTRQVTPTGLAADAVKAHAAPQVLRLQGEAVNTTAEGR